MPAIKKQTTIKEFGKVSKSVSYSSKCKASLEKTGALSQIVNGNRTPICNKRKYGFEDDENGLCQSDGSVLDNVPTKRPKLQQPTTTFAEQTVGNVSPIAKKFSRTLHVDSPRPTTPPELPPNLKSVIVLHEYFLKSLLIHYSHNGPSAPAELSTLMTTITCLYKKQRVVKEDIQRMLALYELAAEPLNSVEKSIEHRSGPFKLTSTNSRTCVEYIEKGRGPTGLMRSPFNEKILHIVFKADIATLNLLARNPDNIHLSFVHGPLSDFPLLSCSMGAQTLARQAVASVRRTEILNLSTKSQQRQQTKSFLSTISTTEDETQTQIHQKVKSRTLALFDRVKNKQLLKTSSTTPTPQAVLRNHAIGRVGEVVEILRMKQQQKLSSTFVSSVHISPSKVRGKVSFSMSQLLQEIKNSVSVPIADDEARTCLDLIEKEVDGFWLTTFEMGTEGSKVKTVVLMGSGLGGKEVQKMLEGQEKAKNL